MCKNATKRNNEVLVCGYRKYPPGHHGREGFVHLLGLSFNINVQSGLKLHSEVVLPDDDSLKPALYQDLVEGFQVCGLQFDDFYFVFWQASNPF